MLREDQTPPQIPRAFGRLGDVRDRLVRLRYMRLTIMVGSDLSCMDMDAPAWWHGCLSQLKTRKHPEIAEEDKPVVLASDALSLRNDRDQPKGWRFGIALFSLCLIGFMSTLDGSIIATALPRIVKEIDSSDSNSNDYVWMANCSVLAQTVIQPPLAQLSNIFGRRTPMLISLALFALGSGLAGGSNSARMLIAGRTIQGLGSGGIMSLIEIIVCDLVPMRERGRYLGIVLSTCSVGAVAGPVVGGALAEADWRWVFYLNLPVVGLVLVIMSFCPRLHYKKEQSSRHSLARVDWFGSILFIASICAILLGLILGGQSAEYSWSSWRIIPPLVLGFLGWVGFHIFEASRFCKEPSMPTILFQNRTSVTGFILVFVSSILLQWVAFFLPFYFQSVHQTDPLKSGIDFLPFQVFLILAAMIAGGILTKTGSYKPFHFVGFAFLTVGVGLLTMLRSDTSTILWVVYQAIEAIGQGFITPSLLPAIQAALDESHVASSTGVFSFLRSFGFTWGLTIPSIVFNDCWDVHATSITDASVRAELSNGMAYRFAANMYQDPFDLATRLEVIATYTATLRTVWISAIPFAALGFCLVFLEKSLRLRESLDTQFGLDRGQEDSSQGVE